MSKMDAQRAMREAKFARDQARAQGTSPTKRVAAPVAPASAEESGSRPTTGSASGVSATAQSSDQAEELCGHRSMNGRTCTRESGHAAKAHRYTPPSK